uniref:DB domain-containing protein n=1 Tax=Elaeophora elaphi TaxID=1147741 RepID=A0A0R3RH27_9BILA
MDNSLRVRTGIRKLHPSRSDTNDKIRRQQGITHETGTWAVDQVAEWLRRWTANPLGFPRVSSNLIPVAICAGPCFAKSILTKVPSFIIEFSLGNGGNRHSNGKINGISIPWKPVMKLPKMRIGYKSTEFRPSGKSNKIALPSAVNNLSSTQLSPYQQQQQYHYQKHLHSPTTFSSRMQEYPSLYYNPWDPFGLLNNPFWKSVFPNLFAPQPQLFISTTPKPARNIDFQKGLALTPKKSSLSPNQKLALCCRKQNLSPSCQVLCNYDTFTDRSLVTAVISNQCPGYELETAFNCATSRADHSACCIRNGIGAHKNGHCMVFCTTHLGTPSNTLQYIDCLQVFDRIKNCYREYHMMNPNIYGDS